MKKSVTTGFRTSPELLEKCDKVADILLMNRNQLFNTILDKVCDEILKKMENNGKDDKQY